MKVKIGSKIYDAEKEPIMLILTDQDKSNIKNMLPECSKFIIFPDHCDREEISRWADTLPCEHERTRAGHHHDQPSYCLDCGEEL